MAQEATTAVSYRRYLKDNRSLFIDHRSDLQPKRPGVPIDEEAVIDAARDRSVAGRGASRRRMRGSRLAQVRFRHLQPAFAPSPFADPLPYVEPWDRR